MIYVVDCKSLCVFDSQDFNLGTFKMMILFFRDKTCVRG